MPATYANLLGGFRVVIDGRPVTRWHAGRARALVQYLLVHRDRPVRPEELREAIWSHLPPASGSTSVKAAVYGARQALRAASPGAARVIRSTPDGYLMRADDLPADVDLFLAAAGAGARSERDGDPAAAAAHYRAAVAVYDGALLPGEDTLWVVEQRERLRTLSLRAIGFLTDQARSRGDDWEVIAWSQRALAVDPVDLEAYESIIETHVRLGLTAQARRWHEVRRERFAEP